MNATPLASTPAGDAGRRALLAVIAGLGVFGTDTLAVPLAIARRGVDRTAERR